MAEDGPRWWWGRKRRLAWQQAQQQRRAPGARSGMAGATATARGAANDDAPVASPSFHALSASAAHAADEPRRQDSGTTSSVDTASSWSSSGSDSGAASDSGASSSASSTD